jgi:hypothetical protein
MAPNIGPHRFLQISWILVILIKIQSKFKFQISQGWKPVITAKPVKITDLSVPKNDKPAESFGKPMALPLIQSLAAWESGRRYNPAAWPTGKRHAVGGVHTMQCWWSMLSYFVKARYPSIPVISCSHFIQSGRILFGALLSTWVLWPHPLSRFIQSLLIWVISRHYCIMAHPTRHLTAYRNVKTM